MAAKKSGQKWIAKNRAPRVQIEYDVEVYGSEKKVQIPFVMGVMADLSGKSEEPLPDIGDRQLGTRAWPVRSSASGGRSSRADEGQESGGVRRTVPRPRRRADDLRPTGS